MEQDVRWKQRFQNYEKAYLQLQRFLKKESLNVDQSTSGTNGNLLGRKWCQFYSRFFWGADRILLSISCVCRGQLAWQSKNYVFSENQMPSLESAFRYGHCVKPVIASISFVSKILHNSFSVSLFLHFFRRNSYFKAVLRSQNYFISAPAPAPRFPLFWLRLQPYIDT